MQITTTSSNMPAITSQQGDGSQKVQSQRVGTQQGAEPRTLASGDTVTLSAQARELQGQNRTYDSTATDQARVEPPTNSSELSSSNSATTTSTAASARQGGANAAPAETASQTPAPTAPPPAPEGTSAAPQDVNAGRRAPLESPVTSSSGLSIGLASINIIV